MDETWLYDYDPATKQQSMECRHSGSFRPQNFRVQKSAGKVLGSIFWDQDGILVFDFLSKGQTINAENYSSLGAIGEYFEGKFHEGCLVLALQCPASPGTCNQEETGLAVPPVS